MRDPGVDYYAILGVGRGASAAEVKKAFKKRALQLHPDRNPHGESLFKEVSTAYQVLCDETKRREYDSLQTLKGTWPAAAAAAAAPPTTTTATTAGASGYAFRDAGRYTHGRYNVSGYTMRQDEHDDVVGMMRRDAEAARKAERCSEEYTRWKQQKEDEARSRREEAAARAPTPPAGRNPHPPPPPARPPAATRQHALQDQIRALWQMHQTRWKHGGQAPPAAKQPPPAKPEAARNNNPAVHQQAEALRQKMSGAKREQDGRRQSAGGTSRAGTPLFDSFAAQGEGFDPTAPFQSGGRARADHRGGRPSADAHGLHFKDWFKGVRPAAPGEGSRDDGRTPFDRMGGVRPASPYHSAPPPPPPQGGGGCVVYPSRSAPPCEPASGLYRVPRSATPNAAPRSWPHHARSGRATPDAQWEDVYDTPDPAPEEAAAAAAPAPGSEAELRKYEALCEKIASGLEGLAQRGRDAPSRDATPPPAREGEDAAAAAASPAATPPPPEASASAASSRAASEEDAAEVKPPPSAGTSPGRRSDDGTACGASEGSSGEAPADDPPLSAYGARGAEDGGGRPPPYARPSTVSAMRTPWDARDGGDGAGEAAAFAAMLPSDREVQALDAVHLEILEAMLQQKLKLVRQVRVLQSIDTRRGGAASVFL
eukprot:TRINITY_DN6892_c0_g2_i1.p1 TRINITY_DN6892_c0_g2~~TRINITY_DN6892_c0_g2_i1.p1  ORF type:complete len:654 (+),score=206.92 TRINITY_DN6892_c0_g2_i1:735-2696(+)